MIEINDLSSIENYFSENLNTPFFPILADLYYDSTNLKI